MDIIEELCRQNPWWEAGHSSDFMAGNMLIEVKYQTEMNDKQRELFEKSQAKKKMVIGGIDDYLRFLGSRMKLD